MGLQLQNSAMEGTLAVFRRTSWRHAKAQTHESA
jgi:hypothetical protein